MSLAMARADRWRRETAGAPSPWRGRIEMLAKFVKDGEAVLDVGAGSQELRGMIPRSCRYVAIDCFEADGVAEVVDLDSADSMASTGDVAVVSGMLEHLERPHRALRLIAGAAPRIILSYAVAGSGPDWRVGRETWSSHLEEADVLIALRSVGYTRAERASGWNDHGIFLGWRLSA